MVLLLLIVAPAAVAQEIVRNEEGRNIIVYPDGTWKYFNEDSFNADDSWKNGASTPEDPQMQANRKRLGDAKNYEQQLALELIRVRLEKVTIEQELAKFREAGQEVPLQTKIIAEGRLQNAATRENDLLRKYQTAKNKTVLLEQILHFPVEVYARKLAEWEKENSDSNTKVAIQEGQDIFKEKKYSSYDPANDVLLNPPVAPCQVLFEGKDASGHLRRDLKPGIIFTKTDPSLQGHFHQNDFIVGQGYLTKISGGILAFTLEVIVATAKAPELFGVFRQREFIELQLLDGTVLRLFNNLNDPGKWYPAAQAYVYKANFLLGMKDEKLLRGSELDLVRVRWSKVQEEFPVYELDFFKHQFDCLDNAKDL
jgi:hypothetical protein